MDVLVGFVMITDAERARRFYVDTLGLQFIADDTFALVVQSGPNMIRLVKAASVTPQPSTVLGWQTDSIGTRVHELTGRGIAFLRYPYFQQDELGIWSAPSGARIAWFADPDGNVLSLTQH